MRPRLFTKILKAPLTFLHKAGHLTLAYIDDLYLQANSYDDCLKNVVATFQLFTKLGFIIHPQKSSFLPSKKIQMLGFILNSEDMTVKPTIDKIESIIEICDKSLHEQHLPIRQVAKILGKMI